MSTEPPAEGERGELSTPPSSFYSMGILGAGDEGDGDVPTPDRSRGKGKARAANEQQGKWARTTPPSPGFDVAHARLEPHQTEVFDKTTAAMGGPTFASNRAKIEEIAREVAKDKGMGRDASVNDVLREACGEYDLHLVLALDQLSKRPLGYDEMEKGGIEVFDQGKDYGGQVNYVHAYEFFCKKTTLAMVEAWESEMGVGSALCGSVRAKANRHEWDNGALRLLISGEGLSASAYKYARGLQQPPTAVRARQPRQANGRVTNDGPAWNVPAGLVLVGGDALDRVGTETYVWRTGDPHRSSRELHETILALVFLGGLVWCPESVGLNQKAGGTFNDEQRARGGKIGGAIGAAPGHDGVGKPFHSGTGASARDFSREGADKRYYGLHIDVPKTELAAELARLVQEDGSLLEEEGKPLPLCSTEAAPRYRGRTKGKGLFGLTKEGSLVMGVHNGNKPNACVSGGTIPVTTKEPPYKVPAFAIAPLRAGLIVTNKVFNETERKLAKSNQG